MKLTTQIYPLRFQLIGPIFVYPPCAYNRQPSSLADETTKAKHELLILIARVSTIPPLKSSTLRPLRTPLCHGNRRQNLFEYGTCTSPPNHARNPTSTNIYPKYVGTTPNSPNSTSTLFGSLMGVRERLHKAPLTAICILSTHR